MGLFKKRKNKRSKATEKKEIGRNNGAPSSENSSSARISKDSTTRQKSLTTLEPLDATMENLPVLIHDLEHCTDTSGDKPARALRILFSLSEHATDSENRTNMVRQVNGRLIPVLLDFLRRCERGSSEQYLALLVLNNVSIPSENKRLIAMDCGGAQVFARLLCEDPSCHLMAIILVNLTFSDAELRRELVKPGTGIYIVESLAYALKLASMTLEEFEARPPLHPEDSPMDLLNTMMEEDKRLRPALSDLDYNSGSGGRAQPLVDPSNQLFPETARWCLAAIKNLTRPSKDATAAHTFINSGAISQVLGLVTAAASVSSQDYGEPSENHGSPSSSSDNNTPPPSDPLGFTNSPATWDSNSVQDAALFIILNLCATPSVREYMHQADTVSILSLIPEFTLNGDVGNVEHRLDQSKLFYFQCVKARMAMAYLVGSSGHFGQPRSKNSASFSLVNPEDSVLNLTEEEVELMVELLANTLHQRAKEGPGGYSAATFNVKGVILAIRCLLTHPTNRLRFVNSSGCTLNVLLLKALAQHAVLGSSSIDSDVAEHACFSLYLMSDLGFQSPFLAAVYGDHDKIAGKGSLTAKVLTSYLHRESITPAGRHAADQLLLRLRYLVFKGVVAGLSPSRRGSPDRDSDHVFDDDLMNAIESIVVERRSHGAKPDPVIFDRPILRSRAPKRGIRQAPWENGAAVSEFQSALEAVKELSFGSTKVRHMDAIDDIVIANNIANSANGEKTESYNYWWSWKDAAGEITKSFERQSSMDSRWSSRSTNRSVSFSEKVAEDPMSFLEVLRCGQFCGADTTVKD